MNNTYERIKIQLCFVLLESMNVINMNNDKVIFEDWEMEKLNELVKYTSEKNLK